MDSAVKPALKQTLLFIGSTLGISVVITYFFDFVTGLIVNVAIFIGATFYITRKQKLKLSGSKGFTDAGFFAQRKELIYVCLSCGRKVTGKMCGRCGSNMKKPLF